MKSRLLRTFISIPVPNSVKNVKQMLTSTCEDEKVVIRWVKHNNLHITLQFLGFTPEKEIAIEEWLYYEDIIEVLDSSRESGDSMDMEIDY